MRRDGARLVDLAFAFGFDKKENENLILLCGHTEKLFFKA
jgi:hypothetical protein